MEETDAARTGFPRRDGVRHPLPKESLIRKNSEYTLCYTQGRRLHTRHFLLFVLPGAGEHDNVRMGTAVSRKVGHAVVRNRIKRLLRECFRLYVRGLPVQSRIVVVANRSAGRDCLTLPVVVSALLLFYLSAFTNSSSLRYCRLPAVSTPPALNTPLKPS